jgi:phage gp36-like protein
MPISPTPSQYATTDQLQQLALTPAAYARFEAASPGCTTTALQYASAEADSYLGSQFQLPLLQWDMALAGAVCVMAAKRLYDTFGYNAAAPIDQLIDRRYAQALEWLAKVANEKVSPQYVDSSVAGLPAGPFVLSAPPVFGPNQNCTFNCDPWGW